MNIAYIRVSSSTQCTENQRSAILEFTNSKKLIVDEFVQIEVSSRKGISERKLDSLIHRLKEDDALIVTELSRIGRSITEIIGVVNELVANGVRLISIKEGIDLHGNHSMQSKTMITLFGLFAELERDLLSARTKEALAAKRAAGIKLGRPKGPGKSKLDAHEKQIQEFLKKGVSLASIAKILGASYGTVYHWVQRHNAH